jgi:hypothetical protein
MSFSSTVAPTFSPADALWAEIVATTREACLLRQEGREEEAVRVLQDTLPPVIRRWSAASGDTPERCRERLKALFTAEQEHMRAQMIQRRLIVDAVCSRLRVSSTGEATGRPRVVSERTRAVQLQRRVPFGDVVGMIDALNEAERSAVAEAIFPAREAVQSLSSISAPSSALQG